MTYEPHLIGNFVKGLQKDLQPWLLADDAFEELFDGFLHHGIIHKRDGYNYLATGGAGGTPYCESRIVARITNEAFDTGDGGKTYGAHILTNFPLRRGGVQIIDAAGGQTATDDGIGGFVSPHSGSVNYYTGEVTITFQNDVPNPNAITATYDFHPGNPVMMIANFINSNNVKELLVADTKYINKFNITTNRFDDITNNVFNGTNHDFFTWIQYPTPEDKPRLLFSNNVDQIHYYDGTKVGEWYPAITTTEFADQTFASGDGTPGPYTGTLPNLPVAPYTVTITADPTGTPQTLTDDGMGNFGSGMGTIDYKTGNISVTFTNNVPNAADNIKITYSQATDYVVSCLKMMNFKDRTLLFRTTELGGTVHPQRIRISGTGSSGDDFTVAASGAGIIDIPSQYWLAGSEFNRDFILFFTSKEHWILNYSGNDIVPFIPHKIDSSRGCDAPFAPISYLGETKAYSQQAFTISDGYNVKRYDDRIPHFCFENIDQDNFDLCFSAMCLDAQCHFMLFPSPGQTKSDRILVNNFDEHNFSVYRIPLSCLGNFYESYDIAWTDLLPGGSHESNSWEEFANRYATWNDIGFSKAQPITLGGGHKGEIFRFHTESDEDNPLRIWNITSVSSAPLVAELTLDTHNFVVGDKLFLTGIQGATELNNKTSFVTSVVNDNTVRVQFEPQNPASFSAYTSGGEAARQITFEMATKSFNPYAGQGQSVRCAWVYFYTDVIQTLETDIEGNLKPTILDVSLYSNDTYPGQPTKVTSLDLKYESNLSNFDNRASRKIWRKMFINQNSKFLQFGLSNSQAGSKVMLHAIMPGFCAGGRLI